MVRILFLPLLALLVVPAVSATAPQTGTGAFTIAIGSHQMRTSGGNTIVTRNEVITITGIISGTCTGSETDILHAGGTFNSHGTCDFTGTVQGKDVSATFRFNAVGTGTSFTGRFGTTHNSGVHVQGTFMPAGPTSGAYTANFHFNP